MGRAFGPEHGEVPPVEGRNAVQTVSLGERYDRGVYVPDLGVGVGSHQLERPRYVGKLNLQKSVSPAYDVYVEQGEQAARVGKDAQRFCRAS